jgi:hypothetical protein
MTDSKRKAHSEVVERPLKPKERGEVLGPIAATGS